MGKSYLIMSTKEMTSMNKIKYIKQLSDLTTMGKNKFVLPIQLISYKIKQF